MHPVSQCNQQLFLSYWFVYFIAAVFPVYWAIRWPTVRLLVLLVACAVFHTHFAGPAGVLPIIVLAVLTYLAGLSRQRWACHGTIVLCVAALVFYKYTKFICQQVLAVAFPDSLTVFTQAPPAWLPGAPPLAISFFVFEFVHYLFDVSRGSDPMRNPLDFSLYAIFWPSIVAGPVKRYQDFLPKLHHGVRNVGETDVAHGLIRVAVGLLKKCVADNMTAYLTFATPDFAKLDFVQRWYFVIALSLRILLDFSGYSDMAIGYARLFGIRLPENFNWPYLATSITTFWHRWHISLSLWIRDYIYIALGGGRKGTVRKISNGLLAFAICGLWHGAGWNFLFWGLYHGVGLAICSNYRTLLGPLGTILADRLEQNPVVSWALTMLFVAVGWVFFFYPLPQAFEMLSLLSGVK
jgi:alginate O-acetyltransferase complex protein AlgI